MRYNNGLSIAQFSHFFSTQNEWNFKFEKNFVVHDQTKRPKQNN